MVQMIGSFYDASNTARERVVEIKDDFIAAFGETTDDNAAKYILGETTAIVGLFGGEFFKGGK